MLDMLGSSFLALLNLKTILLFLGGNLLGTFVGAIPGLGGAVLLTVLLPFIYGMEPLRALVLLLAAHTGIYFSASITAILLNTPGAAESAATTIDGYAMSQQGKGARALGISAAATTIGGWVGVVVLVLMIPLMQKMSTFFQPSEYLLLAIFAIVLIGQLRSGSLTKGLLSGLFGLLISFVGYDPITGVLRFCFNWIYLYNGFNVTAVALGIFGLGEMFILYGRNRAVVENQDFEFSKQPGFRVMDGVRDVFGHLRLTVSSALIGTFLGLIPGIGGLAANFISYGHALKTSKHPEKFGTGIPEGVIAPEGSSIAKEAGSLVPTCALGIPSGVGMAILMSAFTILGIVPGPPMLTSHLGLIYGMAWVIAFGSLVASLTGLAVAPFLARVAQVPGPILVPFIFTFAYLGVYAASLNPGEILFMAVFGILGLVGRRYKYSLPAVLIGFILGQIIEKNFYLSVIFQGLHFFYRPLSDVLLLLIVALLVGPYLAKRFGKRSIEKMSMMKGSQAAVKVLRPELIVDVLWVVLSLSYLAIARAYPPDGRLIPDVVGVATLIIGLVQLAGNFIAVLRPFTHARAATEPDRKEHESLVLIANEQPSPVKGGNTAERRQLWAVAWAFGYVAAIYALGYLIAVPAFFLTYFLAKGQRNWKLAVISAAAMGLITWGVFEQLLMIRLPGSIFGSVASFLP